MTQLTGATLHLEDLAVGQRFESRAHTIDREQIVAFARAYDPQPFHLSDEGAAGSIFETLAASGWHTMALTMRLMVESVPFADGLIGASTEVVWPTPTRPGMALRVFTEIIDVRPSRSKPGLGIVTMRSETRDQSGTIVQIFTVKAPVFKRKRD
ncbi:MaoC family dehydratase [Sphingomonas sp.]|uniref:MaoC family dehydratase n=1 Tax=Sphingomonas sp. TaxID=28214 RepID=UPI00286C211E|nr:MaoC family dehydratase [Sphingomonas sp.]